MRGFQICGFTQSGKTSTATALIDLLSGGGVTVASIKDIHAETFAMDRPGSNTHRHAQAGADPVIARGHGETDFLFGRQMDFLEIVRHVSADWLVVEGYHDFPLPRIVCGKTPEEVDAYLDGRTFAIAGVLANTHRAYKGFRVYNPLKASDTADLAREVKARVFPLLPYVDSACCWLCGTDCAGLAEAVIQGRMRIEDCRIHESAVRLKIDGKAVAMVPFVQRLLRNAVLGVVGELDGYRPGAEIRIHLDDPTPPGV